MPALVLDQPQARVAPDAKQRLPVNLEDGRAAIEQLYRDLQGIVAKDQEQDVMGIALPVLDAVLSGVRQLIPVGHPVLERLHDLISVETITAGEPIRASDALLVVGQVRAALPRPPPGKANDPPSWLR